MFLKLVKILYVCMYVCNITELNIQLNQILNDKIKNMNLTKEKKTTNKLERISQT
jgi:hypothetical protein